MITIYAWWTVAGVVVAGGGWHQLSDHHGLGRLFRRPVVPSAHHAAWTGLDGARRREIHAEMIIVGGFFAAVTGLWPLGGLIFAAVATTAAAWWIMFRRDADPAGADSDPRGQALPAEGGWLPGEPGGARLWG